MNQELRNCSTCGNLFSYTGIREICVSCAQKEEKKYEEVYRFLRKRENRAATIERIVEATDVEETLLHEWVRKGRLQPALFPNLGYPCDKCGNLTSQGKLCVNCAEELQSDLKKYEAAEEFRKAIQQDGRKAYHSNRN